MLTPFPAFESTLQRHQSSRYSFLYVVQREPDVSEEHINLFSGSKSKQIKKPEEDLLLLCVSSSLSHGSFFFPDDGGGMFLRNDGIRPTYRRLHPSVITMERCNHCSLLFPFTKPQNNPLFKERSLLECTKRPALRSVWPKTGCDWGQDGGGGYITHPTPFPLSSCFAPSL